MTSIAAEQWITSNPELVILFRRVFAQRTRVSGRVDNGITQADRDVISDWVTRTVMKGGRRPVVAESVSFDEWVALWPPGNVPCPQDGCEVPSVPASVMRFHLMQVHGIDVDVVRLHPAATSLPVGANPAGLIARVVRCTAHPGKGPFARSGDWARHVKGVKRIGDGAECVQIAAVGEEARPSYMKPPPKPEPVTHEVQAATSDSVASDEEPESEPHEDEELVVVPDAEPTSIVLAEQTGRVIARFYVAVPLELLNALGNGGGRSVRIGADGGLEIVEVA